MAVISRRRRSNPAGTMTVVEHLDELRTRLVIAVAAVAIGGVAGWFLFRPVFDALLEPYCRFLRAHPEVAPSTGCRVAYFSVVEPFLVKLKLSLLIGLGLASPIVLYQLWRFITPGLSTRERRFAIPFVLCSLLLFALGAWFALVTLPRGLSFLLGFAGTERVVAVVSMAKYLGFVEMLILAFGVSFEFPLVLVFLTLVGVLTSAHLRHWRRYAVLVVAAFAAVLTPSQDLFTMLALMVPLLVFYELAILVSRLLGR